jgi:hypothetical protein
MSTVVHKVHPSIGVARVGDSEDHYVAPEVAGTLPINPDGRPFGRHDFRDRDGRVRRQGARFEVFRYDASRPDDPGTPVRPGQDGVERIEWTVHLANKKAAWYRFIVSAGSAGYAPDHPLRNPDVTDPAERVGLIIDPGPRTVAGPNQAVDFSRDDNPDGYPMTFPKRGLDPAGIDSLGGLRTDDDSRLVVLGGFGNSGTDRLSVHIGDYANNDRWWDDTADGPVTARLVLEDGSVVPVDHGGWVAVAPPRFAPELINIVTLYDTMFDAAVRTMGWRPDMYADGLWQQSFRPSWKLDVEPIIERIRRYIWVAAIPRAAHRLDLAKLRSPDPAFQGLREFYLSVVRPPDGPNLENAPDSGLPMMPMLCGDNCFEPGPPASTFLTLTQTQYFYLRQWAAGAFDPAGGSPPEGGAALDRAALDNCVGGAFSPGIEVTWISRDPRIYSEPFRIHAARDVRPPLSLGQDLGRGLEPGDLCKYMALPWQADFNECSQEEAGDRYAYWWPVQRPDYVFVEHDGRLRQVPWAGSDRDQTALDYLEFADDLDMVKLWSRLGFVFNTGTAEMPRFVEVARTLRRDRP